MDSIIDFLVKNNSAVITILVIILIFIGLGIFLVAKHWKIFKSLFTLTENIPLILSNQEQIKNQHVLMSDQVRKIAAETIPNGSNQIRLVYDKIDVIANNVETIMECQAVSNMEFEARLEVDKTPIFKCDEKGRCTFANSSLCHLFDTTQDQMLGEGWGGFIIPRDVDKAFKDWHRFIAQKGIEIEADYCIRTQSGILKEIRYKAVAKYSKEGDLKFIIGTAWEKKDNKMERP